MTMPDSRAIIDAVAGDLQTISIRDFDLTTARANQEFYTDAAVSITADPNGYDTQASTTPSSTLYAGVASIRVGRQTNDPIRLEAGVFIRIPAAQRFWISNAAQTARMLRLYFCPPDYEVKFYLRSDAPSVSPASAFAVAVTGATLISAAQPGRQSIMIKNNDATAILYIGFTPGVTTATGMPLAAGQTVVLDRDTAAVYGIPSAGTIDARVIVEG